MRIWIVAALAVCGLCLAARGTGAQETLPLPGIIGADDRHVVDSDKSPWSAVGQINTTGYSQRIMCTGTLIAPRVVVTAAHCVFRFRTGEPHPLNTIHFVAGARRNTYVGHSTAACVKQVELPASRRGSHWARYLGDIAIVILKEPIAAEPVPLFIADDLDTGSPLLHAGYPRERRFLPTVDDGCALQRSVDDVWLTDCDTNHGNSGGPVFVFADGRIQLAGVMVAAIGAEHSIAIPARIWAPMAENPTCP